MMFQLFQLFQFFQLFQIEYPHVTLFSIDYIIN